MTGPSLPTETVAIETLRPHPRNYRQHPDDQLEHIAASLREHGLYRPVVVARDFTILAGHGLVQAAREKLDWPAITVIRLDLDPDDPRAVKILTGDNELGRLAEVDDRLLSEHLKTLAAIDGGLAGTGFDEQMLASLVYVTRPASEIARMDEAQHWVGLPAFGQVDAPYRLVLSFDTVADRDELLKLIGVETIAKKTNGTLSAWWPPRDKEDLSSVRFE